MDNGAEFVNKEFKEFFYINEILRKFIMPYIPQKNGAAKEKKKKIVESARFILNYAKLFDGFWGETMAITCFIQ